MFMNPREMAGSTMLFQESAPYTGNRFSFREKSRISITASQKMGMDTPIRETTMLTLSTQVFCFTAARMPRGRASRMDTTAATSVSCTVYGKRAMISPVTESPVV